MMKNKAHDLSTYRYSKNEEILLDTNVWMYISPPPSNSSQRFVIDYSRALKEILSAGANIVLDVLVLSEYLNAYTRYEWNAVKQSIGNPTFKAFRKSDGFAEIGKKAVTEVRKILKLAKPYDHLFASVDLLDALDNFSDGVSDFNDELLVQACRKNGWKLMTNDGDFIFGGIDILTANTKLLEACE